MWLCVNASSRDAFDKILTVFISIMSGSSDFPTGEENRIKKKWMDKLARAVALSEIFDLYCVQG